MAAEAGDQPVPFFGINAVPCSIGLVLLCLHGGSDFSGEVGCLCHSRSLTGMSRIRKSRDVGFRGEALSETVVAQTPTETVGISGFVRRKLTHLELSVRSRLATESHCV